MSFLLLAAMLCSLSSIQQVSSTGPPGSGTFRISGVVVDASSGQALSHAQVTIGAGNNSGESVTTGGDGRFAIERLAPGRYSLFARRKGYINQFYKQHENFSTAIVVGEGLDTSNLRFELRAEASISGQVVDEGNDPIRSAQVLLFEQGSQLGRHRTWERLRVNTDDQGRYYLGHLMPGTYFVAVATRPWYARPVTHQRVQQVSGDGQITWTEATNGEPALDLVYPITFFANATDISGAAPITVRSGDEQKADFNLQAAPALHLTIRASLRENENVWAEVSEQLTDGVQQPINTNVQQVEPGVLEISGLPSGRLNLRLHTQRGTETSTRAQVIQVTQDVELGISQSASSVHLSGVAKMQDGSPLPDGAIQLRSRDGGRMLYMPVGSNGEFALENQEITAGEYDVFQTNGRAGLIKMISAKGAKVSGRTIDVSGTEDVALTIVVSKGNGRIKGVALKDDKPVDGVMVVLVPPIIESEVPQYRRDQSDSDGSFNLVNVPAGKYTLVAIGNGWDLDWLTPGVLQKYVAGGEAVEIAPDSDLQVKVKVQQ